MQVKGESYVLGRFIVSLYLEVLIMETQLARAPKGHLGNSGRSGAMDRT
jgi:hypothetical protein